MAHPLPAERGRGAEALRRAPCHCPLPCATPLAGAPAGGWVGAQGFPSGCIFWISPGIAEVPPGAWPCAAHRALTGFSSLSETSGSCLKRQQPPPAAFHLPPPSPVSPHWDPWDPRPEVPSLLGTPRATAMPASDIKVCGEAAPHHPAFLGGVPWMPMAMARALMMPAVRGRRRGRARAGGSRGGAGPGTLLAPALARCPLGYF